MTYKEKCYERERDQRRRILEKFNCRCAYCGCDLSEHTLQVDHFIPKRRYKIRLDSDNLLPTGTDEEDNLFPACFSCNASKSDSDIETFRWRVRNRVERLNEFSHEYRIAKRFGLVSEINKEVIFHFETFLIEEPQSTT